jgi:hypothetical protein
MGSETLSWDFSEIDLVRLALDSHHLRFNGVKRDTGTSLGSGA